MLDPGLAGKWLPRCPGLGCYAIRLVTGSDYSPSWAFEAYNVVILGSFVCDDLEL